MWTTFLTEADINENVDEIAGVVATTDFFGLEAPLKKLKYKTKFYGTKALKASKGGKDYMITSVKNLEDPSEALLVVDGIAIGNWG